MGDGYSCVLEGLSDDGAGGTDGGVEEVDGGVAGEAAEFVVIDDLYDGDAVCSFHRLGEFIVIDEDELSLDGFDEVGFGEDSGEGSVVIEDGKNETSAFGCDFAGFVERGVDMEAGEIAEDHLFDAHGATGEEHGGGGVVGRADDGDIGGPSGGSDFFADGVSTGDDDGMDAFADGDLLDVGSVTDEEDDALVFVAFETWHEGVLSHGTDHEELFDGFGAE